MPIINVSTAEEYGGEFQFYLPEYDGFRDFSAYNFEEDGSVKWKHSDIQIYPYNPVVNNNNISLSEENNNMFLPPPVPPQISNKSKGDGGGGTLGGKESEHESVSDTTGTSTLKRRLELLHESMTPQQEIIAHYLDSYYCDESSGFQPSLMWNMGCNDAPPYVAVPDVKKDLKDTTTTTTTEDRVGLPFLELLSVDIKNNNNNQGCVSLYGTIHIEDGTGPECIYNTERVDSEPISLTGDTTASLLLSGPPRAMSLNGDLFIHLALMDKKKKKRKDTDDDDDDDVFYKGTMHWNIFLRLIETLDDDQWGDSTSEIFYKPPSTPFDKLLSTTFNGKSCGSVTINYVMLEQGVVANVEVTLLKHRGGGRGGDHGGAAAAHVYGLIQAGSNCDSFTYCSVLLQKKKKKKENDDEYIDVRPGQLIPLSRSLVVVNGRSSLKVSVELYDRLLRDTDLSLSQDDDEIVKGTVDFPAQSSGSSEKNISGCYGEIQVKVSWSYR